MYDNWADLSQEALELAWLGSIVFRNEDCQKVGLLGLDSSMFKNKEIFELGLMCLRSPDLADARSMPTWLLEKLVKLNLFTRIHSAVYDEFMPSLYTLYAKELEIRKQFSDD